MQGSSVVEIINLDLALLGQLKTEHIYREMELGLGLVEVLLVESVTSNLSRVDGQHNQWVIIHTESPNVVAHLLAVGSFVLVLERKRNGELFPVF